MAQVINTNIASLNAQRNLNDSQNTVNTALQRLSTGLRINSAKDDAAGLAISERMSTQINGLNQAVRNANDGISLAQTAEGALTQISNNLQRIRELAVQSRNATNTDDDRLALQKEVDQLRDEIDRVAKNTDFNGTKLIDGSFTNQAFQVGANQGQTISISAIANANVDQLGSWTSVDSKASLTAKAAVGVTTPASQDPGEETLLGTAFAAPTDTNGDGTQFDYAGFNMEVNGTTVAVAAATGATANAARADLLSKVKDALDNATGIPALDDLSIDDSTPGQLDFSNAGGAAITITGLPGVTSLEIDAQTDTAASTSFAAITAGQLNINGQDIVLGAATSASQRTQQLVSAINNSTGTTHVKASVDSDGNLTLTADNDQDIAITTNLADPADLKTATGLVAGTTDAGDANVFTDADIDFESYVAGEDQSGFKNLDITTVTGSDNAILAMDAALKSVNESRADLGAIQNRFASVVSSLQTTSENLTASRSRILDADFAAETANLTRGQILQQAGTAMLAQANSLPNNVLTLLRG
ncbi:B-type flagellin [Pigmentiphaga soli]|uniref:Flagellin n=1 Tax=Pigmentiphaga soli TaxID=1007095 RepID=A0ABP8HPV2_9BURK